MGFEILEGITSADIAFLAAGPSLEELFIAAAGALRSVMLQEPDALGRDRERRFTVGAGSLDILLVNFLQEFLYLMDAEGLLLVPDSVEIREYGEEWSLTCSARGEIMRRGSHAFITDVKAVTMHRLSVEREGNAWRATVVLDV
jgi:SHS2 domain-containing protein